MGFWKIDNGFYEAEVGVRDNGTITMGTFCKGTNPRGHYVAVTPEQAISLVRHLCEHVPGVTAAILGKLTEV